MLKATVGVSRTITREFQSTGYSVSLDGEIPFAPDDAEGVLDKVAELFHLAEEALHVQVERDQGDPPDGPRQDAPASPPLPTSPTGHPQANDRAAPLPPKGSTRSPESATPKQQQYLQTLGKRKGLSREDLDALIARVVGSFKKTSDLTKREAGQIIDHLTQLQSEATE
jgi:hypothetical protein